jgi:hypothetical protein
MKSWFNVQERKAEEFYMEAVALDENFLFLKLRPFFEFEIIQNNVRSIIKYT